MILNFWASWCIPCRTEHPVLVQTERTWDDSEVVLLGVVYQDSRANAERFLAQYGGDWTHVLDPSQRTAIDYGVYGVPETFFIGRDGHISHKKVGPVTWDLVRYQVDSLLAVSCFVGQRRQRRRHSVSAMRRWLPITLVLAFQLPGNGRVAGGRDGSRNRGGPGDRGAPDSRRRSIRIDGSGRS